MTATNQIVSRDDERRRVWHRSRRAGALAPAFAESSRSRTWANEFAHATQPARRAGFSLTELLVVIAIIALLAGVLLTAMRTVRKRARAMQTQSTMLEFSNACEAFQMDHGRYPGLVPDAIVAANPLISFTENALLELMGGAIRRDDPQYGDAAHSTANGWIEIVLDDTDLGKIKVNLNRIGEGPVIDGKPYAPYFTPSGGQLAAARGQATPGSTDLPDLLDGWGQPIGFARQLRTVGDLAGGNSTDFAQFLIGGLRPYITSTSLGELGQNQVYDAGNNPQGGILTIGDDVQQALTLAQIIRHSAFGEAGDPLNGTARGAFVLLSAGADGIFFSAIDGPGSRTAPVENIVSGQYSNPSIVDEYDDLRIFGGG